MSSTHILSGGLQDIDFVFKMIMVGDAGVGKTCLLHRFSENTFGSEKTPTTLAIEFETRVLQIDEKVVKLRMWDTMGQERFRSFTSSYYRGTHGIIVAFDLTNSKSFQNIGNWLNEIDQYSGQFSKLLVGTKSDLEDKRVVSREIAQEFADQSGLPYMETSAKTATNVEEAFLALAKEIKKNFDSGVFKNDQKPIKLTEDRHVVEKSWSLSNMCYC